MKHRRRILVADDRPISLRGLTLILSETEDLAPVACLEPADDLFQLLRTQSFDLVLLHLTFNRTALEILRAIGKAFPDLPTLALDGDGDDLVALRILRCGASGYVHNAAPTEELLTAVRTVLDGRTYLSTTMAEKIARELSWGRKGDKPHEKLSRREQEVFRLLASGKRVTEIAKFLNLSVKTVSTHRTRILAKMNLRTTAEMIRYAILNKIP